MFKYLIFLVLLLITIPPVYGNTIDKQIDDMLSPLSNAVSDFIFYSIQVGDVSIPLILVWLVFGAIFFTIYFKFINVRCFKLAIELVCGKYTDKKEEGEVSAFQALSTALSGTVGLGNIAGVAIAISIGGPGATLWMILGGFIAMTSKFVECTLGVKYREILPGNIVTGGPMYYLKKGFAQKGRVRLGKFLAIVFALCCIIGSFGGGCMFQVNQAAVQFIAITGKENSIFNANSWLFGLFIAIIIAVIIIGGIKSIAKVTEKMVPFMCFTYILCSLIVISLNISQLDDALWAILQGAWTPTSVAGGFIGVMIQGFRRAMFSNEAGIGSAAIAHSAVKTNYPASEGIVSLLEPFIDTIIVCTITALVIVISGSYTLNGEMSGIELTSKAFQTSFDWFPYLLALSVILFAISTAISWSYYGLNSWCYLFGFSKPMQIIYQLIFCGFIVMGASLNMKSIINFSDAMLFAMAIPNMIGMYYLIGVVKKELSLYLNKVKEIKTENRIV